MPNALPEFERDPLNEVVLGVQFEPLQKLHAAHLGLYWQRVRDRYPLTEDQTPLLHVVEQPGPRPSPPAPVVVSGAIVPRCYFLDRSQTQLIQLQRDRFLRNWRRIEGTEPYPRFTQLVQEFKREWEGFLAFTKQEELGEPQVNQCELAYVNHIEPGEGWQGFSDTAKVFTFLRASTQGFLPTPESISWEVAYKLPEGRGRLHAQLHPAFRGRDFKMLLALNLTVRGAPAGGSGEQIFTWFDLAHEWVVKAFDELTDPAMHQVWRKKA
jgi:uncharacterized protein (TIGR04255 family)